MSLPPRHPHGRHLLLDLAGIAAPRLTDPVALESALREAAGLAGATVLSGHFHHFGEGGGVTGVLLLSESHISIHTWPEHGFAAVDIFMCGDTRPERAAEAIAAALQAQERRCHAVQRGGFSEPPRLASQAEAPVGRSTI